MQTENLTISGMSCGHCVASVKKALDAIEGVKAETVAVGSATVTYDPLVTNPAALERAVRDAGFEVAGTSSR